MANTTERKEGTTPTAEEILRPSLRAETLVELEDKYADEVAVMMLKRWEGSRKDDPSEQAFIDGAIGAKREGFDFVFKEFATSRMGMKEHEVGPAVIERAWTTKVVPEARKRYEALRQAAVRERMLKTAPPLPQTKPEPTTEPVMEVEPIMEEPSAETMAKLAEAREMLSEFCASGEWHSATLDRASFDRFNGGFFSRLADVLKYESPDARAKVTEGARELYRSVVWPMYRRANGDEPVENAQATFEGWLEKQWPILFDKTKLYQ